MRRIGIAASLAVALAYGVSSRPAAAAPPAGPAVLFDDRHVPIATKTVDARVLGAIARHGTILVPAIDVFRRTGARVDYDAARGRLHVFKPGSDVVLVAGRKSVTIDGIARPLDVAPEIDRGRLYVPIRVVAEAMRAYVEWVPARQIVVIRYVSASLAVPPAAAPSASPVATPATPASAAPHGDAPIAPSPRPRRNTYDRFVSADAQIAPRIANEFVPNQTSRSTANVRVGAEYKFLRGRSFAEAQYRRFDVTHPAGFVTTIGSNGTAFVPSARLTNEQFEFHTSVYGGGHAYLAMSTIQVRNAFGYPRLGATYGFGAELLPQLERPFGLQASYYYYPELAGTYAPPNAPEYRLRYKLQTYTFGAHAKIGHSPGFAEIGYYGDHYLEKENAPGNAEHGTAQIGVGLHF